LGHSIELGYRLSKKANRVYGSLLDKKLQRPDNDSGMYDSEERDAYSERKSNKKKKSGPNIERGLFSMFGNMAKK
jgi:hypothetical protein